MFFLIGFYNYTVWLTFIGMLSSVVGMGFAVQGKIIAAVICLMFSGFCDMFDGIVARTKKDRTDEEKVVIEVETDLDAKKTTEEKDEEAQTKKRNSLLNYHLGPADIIRIQSSDLNGQFIIVRGTHKGSQSGDWKTEIEVRPT